MERVNKKSSRLLKSLKNLNISCAWQGGSDVKFLIVLKQQKNLINFITSLNLPILCSPIHHLSFQNLTYSLPNLRSLSFGFSHQDVIYHAYLRGRPRLALRKAPEFSHLFEVECNFLQAVKTFHKLIYLNIDIADTWTFLKDFVSPPSLKHLSLLFEEYISKEIMYRIDHTFIDKEGENDLEILRIFQENPFFLRFYDNFRNLHHLEKLELNFGGDGGPQNYKYKCFLTQGIIQKTPPSLKKLRSGCRGCHIGLKQPHWFQVIRDTNLPHLFEVCHRFSQTLQTFEIGEEEVIYEQLDLFSSKDKFPQLSTVQFTGKFDDNEGKLLHNMMFFIGQMLSLGESITIIKLNSFINGTIGPLIDLLRQLNQLKRLDNVKLELQLRFSNYKDLEEIPNDLEEKINELKGNQKNLGRLQGVSLVLFTLGRHKLIKKFLEVYAQKFDRLQISSKSSGYL